MPPQATPFFLSPNDPPAKSAALIAALDLFASRGVDGVSIREIAEKSGFTNPAMFKHFKTKEDLARALFEGCYRQLVSNFLGPDVTLSRAVSGALRLIDSSPESVHFVIENLRRYFRDLPPELRANALVGLVRRLVEAEKRRGAVREDVDAQLAAALVLGLLAQIARMAHFHELPRPASELADELYAFINRGLGA